VLLYLPVALMAPYEVRRYNSQHYDAITETEQIYHRGEENVMSEAKEEVLVFSKNFSHHSYGPQHPLKVERLQLTMDLISAYGLFDTYDDPWIEAQEADEQDLLLVHSKEYLQVLKEANDGKAPPQGWKYGLGSGDYTIGPCWLLVRLSNAFARSRRRIGKSPLISGVACIMP